MKLTRRTGVSAGNRGARRSGIAEHSGDEIGDARWLAVCAHLLSSLPPSLRVAAADYRRTDDGRVGPLRPLTTVNRNPWSNNNPYIKLRLQHGWKYYCRISSFEQTISLSSFLFPFFFLSFFWNVSFLFLFSFLVVKWWSKKLSRQRKEKKDKTKGEKKNKNKNLMLVISKCGIGNIKKKKS